MKRWFCLVALAVTAARAEVVVRDERGPSGVVDEQVPSR